ncbi:MAG: hypothetical protein ACKERF_00975 [Candidatus Hodgkinia cicadicola]
MAKLPADLSLRNTSRREERNHVTFRETNFDKVGGCGGSLWRVTRR